MACAPVEQGGVVMVMVVVRVVNYSSSWRSIAAVIVAVGFAVTGPLNLQIYQHLPLCHR